MRRAGLLVLLGACRPAASANPTGTTIPVVTACTPVEVAIDAPGNAQLTLAVAVESGDVSTMRVRSCGEQACGGAWPVASTTTLPELWHERVRTLRFEPGPACRPARLTVRYHWMIID